MDKEPVAPLRHHPHTGTAIYHQLVAAAQCGLMRQPRPDSNQSKHTALVEPVGRSATGSRWSESA